ncbi:MAG: hypothetical protein WAU28_01320, partial [Candidatus Moraniibacteriota bacterium]
MAKGAAAAGAKTGDEGKAAGAAADDSAKADDKAAAGAADDDAGKAAEPAKKTEKTYTKAEMDAAAT